MDESLTDAVLAYKESGKEFDQLVKLVGIEVYQYPRRKLGWKDDDCSDFFCYFYPKVPRLINRFHYYGKPFEAFLAVTLKWQLKTYAAHKNAEALRLRVLSNEGFWGPSEASPDDEAVREDEQPYEEIDQGPPVLRFKVERAEGAFVLHLSPEAREIFKVTAEGRIGDRSARKRMLYLVLSVAAWLPPHMIEQAAHLIDVECCSLYALIDQVQARTERRRLRLVRLSESRNTHFFRIHCLDEQLNLVCDGSTHDELVRRLVRERMRLAQTIASMNRISLCPTHKDIAEVLDVPKGSVDSGLYYLKSAFARLLPNEQIRYA